MPHGRERIHIDQFGNRFSPDRIGIMRSGNPVFDRVPVFVGDGKGRMPLVDRFQEGVLEIDAQEDIPRRGADHQVRNRGERFAAGAVEIDDRPIFVFDDRVPLAVELERFLVPDHGQPGAADESVFLNDAGAVRMKRVENQRGRDRDRPGDADDGVFSLAAKDELLVVEIERFGFRFNRVGDRGFFLRGQRFSGVQCEFRGLSEKQDVSDFRKTENLIEIVAGFYIGIMNASVFKGGCAVIFREDKVGGGDIREGFATIKS